MSGWCGGCGDGLFAKLFIEKPRIGDQLRSNAGFKIVFASDIIDITFSKLGKIYHIVRLFALIALVIVIVIALFCFWFWWSCATQIILPFTNIAVTAQTEQAAQIFAGIFVCIGVIIAIAQYLVSSNQHKKWTEAQIEDVKARKTQKAIEQAGFYKDKILNEMTTIHAVYERSGIKLILDEIRPEAMVEFDLEELKENLSNAKIETIQRIMGADSMLPLLERLEFEQGCFHLNQRYLADILTGIRSRDPNGDDTQAKKEYKLCIYRREFARVANEVLNNLELFAMYFIRDSADEETVFQPLHQTYIEVVRVLYFDICSKNRSLGVDKYYVNLVGLYHAWNKRVKDKQKKIIEHSRKAAK